MFYTGSRLAQWDQAPVAHSSWLGNTSLVVSSSFLVSPTPTPTPVKPLALESLSQCQLAEEPKPRWSFQVKFQDFSLGSGRLSLVLDRKRGPNMQISTNIS